MEEEKTVTASDLFHMKLHEIILVHQDPYYRIMRVSGGWLYNFYDTQADNYKPEWIFVPLNNEFLI